MTAPDMPLDHAHDALSEQVTQFYNEMLRRDVKALPARQWVDEFRSWLDKYKFEHQYVETLKWLEGESDRAADDPMAAAAVPDMAGTAQVAEYPAHD